MSTFPPLPSSITTISYPAGFQQFLQETRQTFIGRQFVFNALNDFFQRCDRGYFTLTGSPGSGKTTILAKYLIDHPHTLYYSVQSFDIQHPDHFLQTICVQLLNYLKTITMDDSYETLLNNATQGSGFLCLLLQKISNELPSSQSFVIALDTLERVDLSRYPPGCNLFYLPRYLPPRIYFLLSRRPFPPGKSGLFAEAPSQTLNLEHYPNQNRVDIQTYIQQRLTSIDQETAIWAYITTHRISEADFCQILTTTSENNFMYLSKLISVITQGTDLHLLEINCLPPELERYYYQHWQVMKSKGQGLSLIARAILRILIQQDQPMLIEAIAVAINEDEYEVAKVLENWSEFLNIQLVQGVTYYNFYHSSFCNFMNQQLNKHYS
jgi:hypothetical protein